MSLYSDSLVYCCHPLAYVCDGVTKKVAVIDLVDAHQTMEIPCGEDSDPYYIAISPNKNCAYVANYSSQTIQKLDLICERPIHTTPISGYPRALDVSPCGGFVYVVLDDQSILQILDADTLQIVGSIDLPAPGGSIAVVPDGRTGYVTLPSLNQTAAVDLHALSVLSLLETGTRPGRMAAASTVPKILVAGRDSHTLTPIDTFNSCIKENIFLDATPSGLAFLNGERECLVALPEENAAAVVSLCTRQVTKRIPVGVLPGAVAASKWHPLAVVCNQPEGTVSIINTSTLSVTATVELGGNAAGAAVIG